MTAAFVKGTHVMFDMAEGTRIKCPARDGMIHDPTGRAWPRCRVLVGPFRRSRREIEPTKEMVKYYGKDYRPTAATVTLPRGEKKTKLGEVVMIYYLRLGTRAPYGFHHPFKNESKFLGAVLRRHPAHLYEVGNFYELVLPDGCIVDDRGYVFP
jgi:hypothetical protein